MKYIPNIRDIKQSEYPFFEDMLYEAIFIPEGEDKPEKDIILHPDVYKYIRAFGRKGDLCLVADMQGLLTGAVWTRLFTEEEKGYGFFDAETPELSMAVREKYRHQGIGTLLLNKMTDRLIYEEYRQVSLSVDKRNYACDFYKRQGFEIVETTDDSLTMVKHLFTGE